MVIQVVAVFGRIDGVVAYAGVLGEFKPWRYCDKGILDRDQCYARSRSYAASKGALLAMMKTRAVEPGPLGVRVIGGRGVGF